MIQHAPRRTAALLALALALLAGCADSNPVGTVSGEVTLDNQPLTKGEIRFVPADGKSSGVSAAITDGKYSVTVPVGEARVEITAVKSAGKQQMYPGAPEVEKFEPIPLPDRYNVRSELKMTVGKGNQEKNFPLTSK